MPYITTCFYCQEPLRMRESILVKKSLSREILHRYHEGCYADLTEVVAQRRLAYNSIMEELRAVQAQTHRPSQVPGTSAQAGRTPRTRL